MGDNSFNNEFKEKADKINRIISEFLPEAKAAEGRIAEAMEYSIMAGGKRVRGILLLETFRLYIDDPYVEKLLAYPFSAAIEMIHTYSLVHDDLPAMDNDTLRRGKPTTHVAFGEAEAILTGDSLLNYAFETINKAFTNIESVNSDYVLEFYKRIANALTVIAEKSGIYGMIGGQALDIQGLHDKDECGNKEDMYKKLLRMYELKTGALIQASLVAGGALGGASKEELNLLDRLGSSIGIAFQIKDDILDITSTNEILGKNINSDEKNDKLTSVQLLGLDAAEEEAKKYTEEAAKIVDKLPGNKDFIKRLVEFLITRNV